MAQTQNGNGSGSNGLKSQLKGNGKIDDLMQTTVLAMFLVQKLGKANFDDVFANAKEIYSEINPNLLEQSLEALRARGLLSYASGKKKDGQHSKMWKTRQTIFAAPPEVAHITDLLPALIETEDAANLIAILNGAEKDSGTKKKKRGPLIDTYYDVEVEFVVLDALLGSTPDSPFLKKRVTTDHKLVEAGLRFWRDGFDMNTIVIPSDVTRGWLRTALRARDCGAATASHIAVSEAKLRPKKIEQMTLPIIEQSTKRGLGLATHEAVGAGEKFKITFRIPTRGFMEPEAFVIWLATYAPNPIRGISPARGGRFGKVAVVNHRVIGKSTDAEAMLKSAMSDLPSEAFEYAQKLLPKAKGMDLRAVGSGAGDDEESDADEDPEAN